MTINNQNDTSEEDKIKATNRINSAKVYSDTAKLAALTSHDIIKSSSVESDVSTLHDEITAYLRMTLSNDPHDQEAILIAQSKTLDLLFNNMVSRAVSCKYIEQMTAYMDMGLKAQNQCRKAIIALQNLKHPQSSTFIKQQNLAFNQQVNNNEITEKKIKSQNELLSIGENYAQLVIKGSEETIGINQTVEAVE